VFPVELDYELVIDVYPALLEAGLLREEDGDNAEAFGRALGEALNRRLSIRFLRDA
jgi:hypothetical protein